MTDSFRSYSAYEGLPVYYPASWGRAEGFPGPTSTGRDPHSPQGNYQDRVGYGGGPSGPGGLGAGPRGHHGLFGRPVAPVPAPYTPMYPTHAQCLRGMGEGAMPSSWAPGPLPFDDAGCPMAWDQPGLHTTLHALEGAHLSSQWHAMGLGPVAYPFTFAPHPSMPEASSAPRGTMPARAPALEGGATPTSVTPTWPARVVPRATVLPADARQSIAKRGRDDVAEGAGRASPGSVDDVSVTTSAPHQDKPAALCVRCSQGDKHSSNALRRIPPVVAERIQANLPFLQAIFSTQDLRHRLLEAGHGADQVGRWLGAIHQKPGKYCDRLPHMTVGTMIHKKCQDCVSILLRTLPDTGSNPLKGRRYPSVSKRLRVEATGTADCADVTHPRAAASPATAEGASPATHVAGR